VTVLGVLPVDLPAPALSNADDPPSGCQCVDQRWIPVVQIPAEVLQQHQQWCTSPTSR
jgi:hypothetical protein